MHRRSTTSLALMDEEGKEGGLAVDEVKVVRLYRLAAAQGHARAQYNLAWT